jgi:hypothetical protein
MRPKDSSGFTFRALISVRPSLAVFAYQSALPPAEAKHCHFSSPAIRRKEKDKSMITRISSFIHRSHVGCKQTLAIALCTLAFTTLASGQSWTALNNQPTFYAGTALLLTDGTVMVQQMTNTGFGTGGWWRLTPDGFGSYVNGTWSPLAAMPAGYGPLFYGSAVLPDGRVVVVGGEHNLNQNGAETNMGAIYNPATNSWTSIAPPSGVSLIGDAASVVLPNGTFMLSDCCSSNQYLLNAFSLTWTFTGSGKADRNSEEGWALLPNSKVLTVDASNSTNSELYNPATGTWSTAGSTIVPLSDGSPNFEVGPSVLRPDGTVFATGGTSNTAIYNTVTGAWSVGPTFSSGLDVADGPAALLPSGNVLVMASPGVFNPPSQFFEFNGTNLLSVPAAAGSSGITSFQGRMLVLPTGQIFFTDQTPFVQVYTASGTFQNSWRPTIASVASSLTAGTTNNAISGTQFNGLSQGGMYGDDAQMATNYPLVRITNNATAHVVYAKTHSHSTMAVATGSATVSTQFDIPATIDTGASTLQVVANGIPSAAVAVTINPPPAQARGTIVVGGAVTCFDGGGCDSGTATITMNGRPETIVYDGTGVNGPGTLQGIAVAFANAFNGDSGSFVTAAAVQDANPPYNWDINFVTKATGNVNYVFSTAINSFGGNDPGFSLTPTLGQLTGGH